MSRPLIAVLIAFSVVLGGSHYPDSTGTSQQVTRWHERSIYLKSPTTRWLTTTWGGMGNGSASTILGGYIYATLWVAPVTGVLTSISIQNTNATSYTCRTGAYSSNDGGYPDALLADFGERTWAETGVVDWTGNAPVSQGRAYWIVAWCSGTSGSIKTANGYTGICFSTTTSTPQPCASFRVSYAWTGAGLPSSWPAGSIAVYASPLFLLRMTE